MSPCGEWGDLRQQAASRRGVEIDLEAFGAWCLVDLGRAPATVQKAVARVRYMGRHGVSWTRFLESPGSAKNEARRFLAGLAGRPGAQRNYVKTLNWVALYAAAEDPRFEGVRWRRPAATPSQPRRFTDSEVEALGVYSCLDGFLHRRRRCLLWVCRVTGLRRGEVGDIQIGDLDGPRGVLYVGRPRKNGRRREIPLPGDAFHPRGPLAAWLAVHPSPARGALWVDRHGRAMGGDALARDLWRVAGVVGFPVSFNRFRHWRGRLLARAGVPLQVVQAAYGHTSPSTTMHYVGLLGADDMAAAYSAAGLPGYAAPHRSA